MAKPLIIFFVIVFFLSAFIFFRRLSISEESRWACVDGEWVKYGNPKETEPAEDCGNGQMSTSTSENKDIRVSTPKPGDIISSPLRITGEARGVWFFEASFPVSLLDGNGKIIAQMPAQAQSDWMTAEFVPFSADLRFLLPETKTGTLVFEKDNPSGLPENAAEIRFEVRFIDQASTTKVKVYFGNSRQNLEAMDCSLVFPAERVINKTEAIARKTLEELLAGPTREEDGREFFTSINSGVTIQKLTIASGTAKVDLSKRIEEELGGSCRVTAIRAQITETLKQFPTVKEVIISIDGRTEDILQP